MTYATGAYGAYTVRQLVRHRLSPYTQRSLTVLAALRCAWNRLLSRHHPLWNGRGVQEQPAAVDVRDSLVRTLGLTAWQRHDSHAARRGQRSPRAEDPY